MQYKYCLKSENHLDRSYLGPPHYRSFLKKKMYRLIFSAFWPKSKRKGPNSKKMHCVQSSRGSHKSLPSVRGGQGWLYWQTYLLSKGLQHAERLAINGKGENSLKKCFNCRVLATAPASFQHLPEQERVHGWASQGPPGTLPTLVRGGFTSFIILSLKES